MSIIKDSVETFLYTLRRQGWRKAFHLSAQFLLSPIFESHTGYVLYKSLLEPIYVPPPEVEVQIKYLNPENSELLASIMPPLRVKRIDKKLQAGEMCCVAIKDGNIISYVLAGIADTPSTRAARFELEPKEAYLWAGYALPQYRRMGLVMAVNLNLCRLLQELGYERSILLVERENKASLGHCTKMGYRITENINYLRILKWAKVHRYPIEPADQDPSE